MARQFALLSSLVFIALACEESITAPGACPEYCAPGVIGVLDTILMGSVERDSAFQGYVQAFEAPGMQVSGAGASVESRGVIRFRPFSDTVATETGTGLPVVQIDSFGLALNLIGRTTGVSGIEIVIHRVPATVDSSTTFADLEPYFADSTIIASIAVHDTVAADSLRGTLPSDAFPTPAGDSLRAAIGISVRGDAPAFVSLAAAEFGLGAALTRFVQADSADGELAARSDVMGPDFDTFVRPLETPLAEGTLAVGGLPSTRSLLRFTLPSAIIDSSTVVGATLILVPIEPAIGAPGASFQVVPAALGADFGPKSPVILEAPDTLALPGTTVDVGAADTIAVDLTDIFAQWQDNEALPHSIMLRIGPEGSSLGEFRFGSSLHDTARPSLHITFVPPLDLKT
jgi:hypothetical protein